MQQPEFGVVLLLGPPGVGKSLLGEALCQLAHGPPTQFLNAGEQLRARGLLAPYQEHPTEAGRLALEEEARELQAAAFSKLAADQAGGQPRWGTVAGCWWGSGRPCPAHCATSCGSHIVASHRVPSHRVPSHKVHA